MDGMYCMPCSMSVTSSPMEKLLPVESQTTMCLEVPDDYLMQEQKRNLSLSRHAVEADRATSDSLNLCNSVGSDSGKLSNFNAQSSLFLKDGGTPNMISTHYENGLFSSSLSELFGRQLRLLPNNDLYGHSIDTVVSHYEEEPFESLEEIEAQTIGNLLPNDDDLFSGVVDGLEEVARPGAVDDIEDLDLFSSVGGMDLGDDNSCGGQRSTGISGGISAGQLGGSNVSIAGEHSCGEHPSRTLFVRNINSDVEDSELRAVFEQYGDIHNLYMACKHRGFVMISYYDIRAARNAMKALQDKPLRRRKLDIHYSIPKDNLSDKDVNQGTLVVFNLDSSVSNDDLHQIFGVYGEIKEIHDMPYRNNNKFIEFYDVRAAETALHALNRSDIAGKRIKLELSSPGGTRSSTQLLPPELGQDKAALCMQQSSPGSAQVIGFSGYGSSANGSCPLPRHHYMWSNSNHAQIPSMMWPNSLSFGGGVCAVRSPSRLQAIPRTHSHMLNSAVPTNTHHVGSAPAVNSPWDRRNAYLSGSPDTSGFHQGAVGSMRLSGSPLHHMEFVSPTIFQVGGNCMDLPMPSRNVGVNIHHQSCMLYSNRAHMNSLTTSFEPPNERLRSRRSDSSSIQSDNKKQYELDLDRILRGEDNRTTLMIKNIPNKYTSKMLMAAIDERHRGTYDFIYLPIDFKNKCNVGYAFINMVDPSHIIPFYETFNGKKWEKFNSEKVASLAYARIQGKQALIAHFQNSSLMNEDKRCRPILFHTDGPNAGDQVPFPMGMNVRTRPGKPRSSISEDNNQGSSPNSSTKGESFNGDSSSGSGKELD
ncbi:hypothetical protein Ancab_020420 [Ancistrocladus abbreviatus]